MSATGIDLLRFKRQVAMPGIGEKGMELLKGATVLHLGMGGGGCAASHQFAMSNIGRLILCDHDEIEYSNLGRQYLYREEFIGMRKVDAAKISLKLMNPDIEIETIPEKVSIPILDDIRKKYDNLYLFLAVDNFDVHIMVNQYCIQHKIPAIHILSEGYKGFVYTYDPQRTPRCVECTMKDYFKVAISELDCDKYAYLSPVIPIPCSMGVIEAIKMILNYGNRFMGDKFLIYRGVDRIDEYEDTSKNNDFFEVRQLNKNLSCKWCVKCS